MCFALWEESTSGTPRAGRRGLAALPAVLASAFFRSGGIGPSALPAFWYRRCSARRLQACGLLQALSALGACGRCVACDPIRNYVEGIGLEQYMWLCLGIIGERYQLVGTVINGDTTGTISPDSSIVPVREKTLVKVKVFPNPANDHLVIEGLDPSGAMLALFDLQGRRVTQRTVHASSATLDVSSLSDGIYILSVPGARHFIPVRVVVAH